MQSNLKLWGCIALIITSLKNNHVNEFQLLSDNVYLDTLEFMKENQRRELFSLPTRDKISDM